MIAELEITWPRILKIWLVHYLWILAAAIAAAPISFLAGLMIGLVFSEWLGASDEVVNLVFIAAIAPILVVSIIFPIRKIMNRNFKEFRLALLDSRNENIILQATWKAAAVVALSYLWRAIIVCIAVLIVVNISGYAASQLFADAEMAGRAIEVAETVLLYMLITGMSILIIRASLFVQFDKFRLAIIKNTSNGGI